MTTQSTESFRKFMADVGLDYFGEFNVDGRIHRVRCSGDKEANSWYVLFAGDRLAGAAGCWKRGIKHNWSDSNGHPLSGADLAEAKRRWREAEVQQAKEQAALHERMAASAEAFIKSCHKLADHDYLKRKRVGAFGPAVESPDGDIVLPLADADGKVWSYQTIDSEGDKLFMPAGKIQGCFYQLHQRTDGPIVVCEGYATGATIYESTGWEVVCAMNCGNLLLVCQSLRKKFPNRKIIVAADNDERLLSPEDPNRERGVHKATAAANATKSILVVPQFPEGSAEGTDFNDLAQQSGLLAVTEQLEKANPRPMSVLSFDEISLMPISSADRILGDHLLDKGSPLVIAGQGGAGKSRLGLQMVASLHSGAENFLNFTIHAGGRNMRWLILQSENSLLRLKTERDRLKSMLGSRYERFNEMVKILTPITETDTFLNLDNLENYSRLQSVIDWFLPDGIVFDSLYNFGVGDINKDSDMQKTLMLLSRLAKHRNPNRSIVVLHHALTGKSGIERSTGYDRTSFGRNSKVLFNWTRAQINLAPMNEDNSDQIAVSCGKCSDGREFQSFAINLNPETLVYECDPTVNVKEWSEELKGNRNSPDIEPEGVAALCDPGCYKSDLSKKIMEEIGCSKASAYRHIRRTIESGNIKDSEGRLFRK